MNWYAGNIAEAVKLSQQRNAIFVVYVEGNDELSLKMRQFINEDDRIKTYLESENFVAIRIESGSESYMQFAQIYQLVPLPSLFFIGRNGTPLEVATGVVETPDDLIQKIEKAIRLSKSPNLTFSSAEATNSFIAGEQSAAATAPQSIATAPLQSIATPSPQSTANSEISDLLETSSKQPDTGVKPIEPENNQEEDHAAKLEKARLIIAKKRKEKEAEEERREREKEIERRKAGKTIQSFKEKQKEDELLKLKEERIRDRLENEAARQRILKKIASDKAERAQKFNAQPTASQPEIIQNAENSIPKPSTSQSNISRIQFRTPDGHTQTHTFNNNDHFEIIRSYVATTVLQGAVTEFRLATTFPKREFTVTDDIKTLLELGLCPSALILIFCNLKHSTIQTNGNQQSGQMITMFQSMFMSVLSPFFTLWGYFTSLVMGDQRTARGNVAHQSNELQISNQFFISRYFYQMIDAIRRFFGGGKTDNNNERANVVGTQKRSNEDTASPNDEAKRRNISRLVSGGPINDGASTSSDSKLSGAPYRRTNVHRLTDLNDSDDENATWNGNSTQQQ